MSVGWVIIPSIIVNAIVNWLHPAGYVPGALLIWGLILRLARGSGISVISMRKAGGMALCGLRVIVSVRGCHS